VRNVHILKKQCCAVTPSGECDTNTDQTIFMNLISIFGMNFILVVSLIGGSWIMIRRYIKFRGNYKDFREYRKSMDNVEMSKSQTQLKYLSNITVGDQIGKGKFGTVYKGKWLDTDVVLKQLVDKNSNELEAEAMALSKLNSPHIVRYFGVFQRAKDLFICTEFVELGDLKTLLDKREFEPVVLVKMAMDAALGMQVLEQEGVVHRDLAARNLLVEPFGSSYRVKVADFGLSRLLEQEDYYESHSHISPYRWTAPEGLQAAKFSLKSDVWSYGVVLYEIFSGGAIPYYQLETRSAVLTFVEAGQRLAKPFSCPEGIYAMMLSCWQQDPSNRPNFTEIFAVLQREIDILEPPSTTTSQEEFEVHNEPANYYESPKYPQNPYAETPK